MSSSLEKRIKLRTALFAILVCIIISSTIAYSYAVPTLTFNAFTALTESDYIIFNLGTTYYLKNGGTGSILYQGSNASAIFNAALALGGRISVRSGKYYFNNPIIALDTNFILEGQGWGNIYDIENGEGTFLIKHFNGGYLINVSYSPSGKGPFIIRNMAIIGDKTVYTGGGILVNGADIGEGWQLSDLRIRSFTLPCINVTDAGKHVLRHLYASYTDSFAIWYKNVGDWQWYDVEADIGNGVDQGGAFISYSSGEIFGGHFEGYYGLQIVASNVHVIGTKIIAAYKTGIFLSSASGCTITDAQIADSNVGDFSDGCGILIYASDNVRIINNRITDNAGQMRYCIMESGGVQRVGNIYALNFFGDYLAAPTFIVWTNTTQVYNSLKP